METQTKNIRQEENISEEQLEQLAGGKDTKISAESFHDEAVDIKDEEGAGAKGFFFFKKKKKYHHHHHH